MYELKSYYSRNNDDEDVDNVLTQGCPETEEGPGFISMQNKNAVYRTISSEMVEQNFSALEKLPIHKK